MAMKPCKECGQEVSSDAKKCPKCGKDQRNFFVQHKILTIIGVFIILGIIGSLGGEDSTSPTSSQPAATKQQEPKAVPTVVTVNELVDALDANALNASKTYKGKYVEMTGELQTIDSSGDYFSLAPMNEDFSLDSVLCNITEDQVATVSTFTEKQKITVVGTITDVGEVLGYTLEVESIK